MADVFDYLYWRGDLAFEVLPPNEADRLILAMFSFMDLEGIVSYELGKEECSLSQAVLRYFLKYPEGSFVPSRPVNQDMRRFAKVLADSNRFGGILLSGYRTHLTRGEDPDLQVQFAALTARFSDGIWISFRGTDDTLVGWKENFNSAFLYPLPAQSMALTYLEKASALGLPIYLQGHSKGGNLAVYAAANAKVDIAQLVSVYDFDGPGFDASFFQMPRYKKIKDKICKFLPEYAIIGLIRECDCRQMVIKSSGKGLSQHNGFHWQFVRGGLQRAQRLDPGALLLNSRLKKCYHSLAPECRRDFVEGAYEWFCAGGRQTLTDLSGQRRKLFKDYKALDAAKRKVLKGVFSGVFRELFVNGEKNS